MEDEELLESLRNDLTNYRETLEEVAERILNEGITKYPIFIAHQHEMTIGKMILDKDLLFTNWSINVSTIEELIAKNVLDLEKKDDFASTFTDPKGQCCLLMVTQDGAKIIFLAYEQM